MTPLLAAALELQGFFEARNWPFCIIGGIALLRWGTPRFTRDVDVALLTGFGEEDRFIGPLLEAPYRPRIADAAGFARRSRVLLLETSTGVPLDISLAALPYESLSIERSSLFVFERGCNLRTCSAEDLVVQKLFALRPQDILDAESVVACSHGRLDWFYIETQLAPLAEIKADPAIMVHFNRLKAAT